MAKIIRPDKDFPIFGGGSQADELKIFGTETESTDITLLLTNTNAAEGWASGVDANGFPALSWFNAVGHTLSYITAYYLQNGIPEWVALQEYFIGSKAVASDGFTYVSKTDNNIGNTPVGDSINWRLAFLDSANTVVYVPTANYHPATKKYVDDEIAAQPAADTRLNIADEDYAGQPANVEILNSNAGEWVKNQCTAWVLFNGVTPAITDQFNIASIVRTATGFFTINFATPMDNLNYSVTYGGDNSGGQQYSIGEVSRTVNSISIEIQRGVTPTNFVRTSVQIIGGKV